MDKEIEQLLNDNLPMTGRIGIVGVGKLGCQIADYVKARGLDTLLCDPPKNMDEADELSESFFSLWGNGMGGCELTGAGLKTYLPLEKLATADAIVIQVPLTDMGNYPTKGMFTKAFLDKCSPEIKIICLCSIEVFTDEVCADSRIVVNTYKKN